MLPNSKNSISKMINSFKNFRLLYCRLFMVIGAMGLFSTTYCHGQVDATKREAPEATSSEANVPFGEIPELQRAFIEPSPSIREDGIPVGTLGVDGGDKEMILALAQEIAEGKHSHFDALLIAQSGKLLFESYYSRGRINLPHPQASATKAYTSLALGRAMQLGYLTMDDLDKPLIHFLKDLDTSKLAEGAETITLHKALTMRSGIGLTREELELFRKEPESVKGQRQVQVYLENSQPISEASQQFNYKFDPMLVMQVIEAIVPGTAEDFIKRELLDKMGIHNYEWPKDISGLPRAGSRTSMTARDMVKWGLLVANNGEWNGEPLIPGAYIQKAVHRIVDESNDENFLDRGKVSNIGYGYLWWQADLESGGKMYFSTSAQGGSGQMIILIDSLDLMVITTVHRLEISVLQLVAERILPAFIN